MTDQQGASAPTAIDRFVFNQDNLLKSFPNGTAGLTDEHIKQYLQKVPDGVITAMLQDEAIAGWLNEWTTKQAGKPTEEQLTAQREYFRKVVSDPNSESYKYLNDPANVAAAREALAASEFYLKGVRSAVEKLEKNYGNKIPESSFLADVLETTAKITGALLEKPAKISQAIDSVVPDGTNAAMWGGSAWAQAFLANGGRARGLASFFQMSAGKVPVLAPVIETAIAGYHFSQGNTEEGVASLGGGAAGIAGTIVAGKMALGTAAAATAPAWIVPAAIGVASYYAGKNAARAGYLIYDTLSTYSEIDKLYKPDYNGHRNCQSALMRVVGDAGMNSRLAQAGVATDRETGRVSWRTLDAALVDPKTGPGVAQLVHNMIWEKKGAYDGIMAANTPFWPRWFIPSESSARVRQTWEAANMDSRQMYSGAMEFYGYCQGRTQAFQQAKARADAELEQKLQPYRQLEKENPIAARLMECTIANQYEDYRKNGGPLDKDAFIITGKVNLPGHKAVMDNLRTNAALIQYVLDREMAQWKAKNPSAEPADVEGEKRRLMDELVKQYDSDTNSFIRRIEEHKKAETSAGPSTGASSGRASAPSLAGTAFTASASGARERETSSPVMVQPQPRNNMLMMAA